MKKVLPLFCILCMFLCCSCGWIGPQKYVCEVDQVKSVQIVRVSKWNQETYEYEYTVGGVTYRYLQIIIGYKSMIYNLTYTALPQNFEANRADVEAIIAAFTFR